MRSYGGHLARVDLSMLYSSVNTCQNQVKLCTLKVQDGSLGPKLLAQGPKFLDCYEQARRKHFGSGAAIGTKKTAGGLGAL